MRKANVIGLAVVVLANLLAVAPETARSNSASATHVRGGDIYGDMIKKVAVARPPQIRMSGSQSAELSKVIQLAGAGNVSAATESWKALVTSIANTNKDSSSAVLQGQLSQLVYWVLHESYRATVYDLYRLANKSEYYTEQKNGVRQYLEELRNALKSSANSGNKLAVPVKMLSIKAFSPDRNGAASSAPISFSSETVNSVGELESYIEALDNKLQTVGDDSQLANIDMQNMLKKQQQKLQIMSNAIKQFQDTAMAIIRKIGG